MDEASLIAAAQWGSLDAFNKLRRTVSNACYDELRRRKRHPITSA